MQSVYDEHKTDRVFWPPLSRELAWYLPTALLAMKGIWTETWISSYFGIIMTTASRKSRRKYQNSNSEVIIRRPALAETESVCSRYLASKLETC